MPPQTLGPELDPAQARAVQTEAPRVLVLAGAGSGKTRCLTSRVAHLVTARGTPPERVLLATFTQRAAREMTARIARALGPAARRVRAGTFHALALATLRAHGDALGLDPSFVLLARDERRQLLSEALAAAGVDPRGRPGITPDRFERALARAENDERPLSEVVFEHEPDVAILAEALEDAAERYARAKAGLHALDFDDLLVMWRVLLDPERDTGRKLTAALDHVLVDEYQDTTPIQARIAEDLAETACLFVVGDDAQSIYGFRGARFDNILEFPTRAPTEVHRLVTSYRSAPAVMAVARAALEQNPLQFPKPLVSARPDGAPVELLVAEDERDEARDIARRIRALADHGNAPFEDQAILVRRHRDADPIELARVEAGIPHRLRGERRFADRPHVAATLAYLRLLARPDDVFAWRRVLALWPGIGPVTVQRLGAALLEAPAPSPAARLRAPSVLTAAPPRARSSLTRLSRVLQALEPLEGAGSILRALLDLDDGRGPILTLGEDPAAVAADLERLRTLDDRDPREAIEALGLGEAEQTEGPPGVTVGTIHAAKGLEWPVVFVPGLVDGRFPAAAALRETDGEAEERRLFYVAVTRAMDRLVLSHPRATHEGAPLDASRFLTELAPGLLTPA
jgi:DNA helicase-2/ATP-dependent DNA helicase PcrA